MSRTYKREKDAGYEYWPARPGNKHGSTPGSFTKHVTHKRERLAARKLSRSLPKESNDE